jgi:hypothetical protein
MASCLSPQASVESREVVGVLEAILKLVLSKLSN